MTCLHFPVGPGTFFGILKMKNYSIVRIGNEYIVQANDKSVLKIASRRMAARTVTDAAVLLDQPAAPPLAPQADPEPSIACDPRIVPDRSEVP